MSVMKILIVHPMDPSGNSMGGVSTYLRDFLKFLPDVFSMKWIGITSGKKTRPKGRWGVINCAG